MLENQRVKNIIKKNGLKVLYIKKFTLYLCHKTKRKKKDYEKFRIKKQSSSEIRSIWI